MKKVFYCLVACVLLMLASCGNDPKISPVVGDWDAVDSKMEINMTMGGMTFPIMKPETETYQPGEMVFSLKKDNSLWLNGDSVGTYVYDADMKQLTVHSDMFMDDVDEESLAMIKEMGVDLSTFVCAVPMLTKEAATIDYQSTTAITIPGDILGMPGQSLEVNMQIAALINLNKKK